MSTVLGKKDKAVKMVSWRDETMKIVKNNAKKVRRLGPKQEVIAGFAGSTADALTLFDRLEAKLEQYPTQLTRAAVELAKDWRLDRYLRRLEAMMLVADNDCSFVLTGNGDVLEPEDGVIAIGSGGNYALAAAKALYLVHFQSKNNRVADAGCIERGIRIH